ncbi:MAG TPA: YceD family protein [Gammaproteobacteria bacterium]|nr:YceD family protein [Gammaproteobacteria bacterium]
MSGALHSWYSLPDLVSLAERGAVLEGTIEFAKLGRLKDLLNSCEGRATARMSLSLRHDDMVLLQLQCEADLELVCQRCLEPVIHEVREQVDFAVADNEEALAVLPQGLELIALEGDRLQPATLIEDELIVSLPLVPKHGSDQDQEM